ncbi:MAG: efflux RND transporter permease subunit [Planctomycetaceae bacterium]|jgi:multidrug efflux pump subunit AcrB|nr:efflux RND transporter permease subunit [Planctomycetaceae bacterium]
MLRSLIRWVVANSPAMNILLIAVLAGGIYCAATLRRETFPEFDMEMITVSVPYPGATPEEVENGICQKIEEALQTIEGVRKMTSTAGEGMGTVMLELRSNVKDVDRILNEVKEAVDRIPSFPELAENRIVQRVKMQETVIQIGILGPASDSVEAALHLRQVAEDLRQELLQYSRISMVNLVGTKDYQIDIEIPESTLRSYKMTLDQAAGIIRNENVQTPGGTIRAPSQEINVRTDNRRYDSKGIGELPLITNRDGTVIKLKEVANVRDEFVDGHSTATIYMPPADADGNVKIPADTDSISGRHVVALNVLRNTNEDLLAMMNDVYDFVQKKQQPGALPPGYSVITWGDHSTIVKERLQLLSTNGLQGLLIVFILLTLFLDMKLAFWVALGIPFSICAACVVLDLQGQTMNMITMFAFIVGLGIVVDDAIVAGENVYRHREQLGKDYFTAAVDGVAEIAPAVSSSVLTTIIAFVPLIFVEGFLGKIFYLVPVVLIAMLIASLFECFTMLPCHLAHKDNLFLKMLGGYLYIFSFLLFPLRYLQAGAGTGMDFVVKRIYAPSVKAVLRNRMIFVTASCCVLVFCITLTLSGRLPFVFFPKMDGDEIQTNVSFPNGTPAEVTEKWTKHLERSFWKVAKEYEDKGIKIANRSLRIVGNSIVSRGGGLSGTGSGGNSHQGGVTVELTSGKRSVSSMEIVNRWREVSGSVPGAEELTFTTQSFGPQHSPIEFLLAAPLNMSGGAKNLEAAVEECKEYLANIDGTRDIKDGDVPGKYEFNLKIKDKAKSMGVYDGELASVIRATYYGAEVQRLQRGRHEVKVMVCYPREDRRSLGDFNEIRVRTGAGEFPITELAEIEVVRGYTSISRRNQMRTITVSSDIEEGRANAMQITSKMQQEFFPALLKKYPGLQIIQSGDQEHMAETMGSLWLLFSLAMCGIFVVLTIQFRSYLQPFMVMAIIPFGWIGVTFGHWFFGYAVSMTSGFGFVALCGVIINDSIVMIDFINRRVRDGAEILETLVEVGQDRFRPIFLTSATTLGGLLPLVFETSLQAKIMIPMALSLACGVGFALIFVLYFVPVLYSFYTGILKRSGIEIRDRLIKLDADRQV